MFVCFYLVDITLFSLSDQEVYKDKKGLLLIVYLIYYFYQYITNPVFFPSGNKASYYNRALVQPTISSICCFNSLSFQIIHHVKSTQNECGQGFKQSHNPQIKDLDHTVWYRLLGIQTLGTLGCLQENCQRCSKNTGEELTRFTPSMEEIDSAAQDTYKANRK